MINVQQGLIYATEKSDVLLLTQIKVYIRIKAESMKSASNLSVQYPFFLFSSVHQIKCPLHARFWEKVKSFTIFHTEKYFLILKSVLKKN